MNETRTESPTIRLATPTDALAIARVHVDSWRATYRGIVPKAYLDALSYAERSIQWEEILNGKLGRSNVFVAIADERIAGFSSGGPIRDSYAPYVGELYSIYLHPQSQRSGLGTALAKAVARRLSGDGLQSMLVWVLADNPACQFYEALGAQSTPYQQTVNIGGKDLLEIAYGWPDIRVLTGGS